MMARQMIRAAIRDRLSEPVGAGWHTLAEDRVFSSRTRRITISDMPCLVVFARSEKIIQSWEADSVAYADRELLLTVAGVLHEARSDDDVAGIDRDDSGLDDQLDLLAGQIERAFLGWEIPGLEGADFGLQETELHVATEGAEPHGNALLTWRVAWRSADPLPGIVDPPIPTTVVASWSPRIGIPHEEDYRPVDGSLPEIM